MGKNCIDCTKLKFCCESHLIVVCEIFESGDNCLDFKSDKFSIKEIREMFIKQNSMINFADDLSKEMMWSGYLSAFAKLDLVDMESEE